jgi:prefoldin subunit 5
VTYGARVVNIVSVVTRPLSFAQHVDSLVDQLALVASRALSLLDTVETIPGRIEALLDRVSSTATGIDALATRASTITDRAERATDQAAGAVAAVQPLVDAAATLDTALVGRLEPLLEGLMTLPAVLETLAKQVEHLDQTVAEVGTLLQGIPGAQRLIKRGGDRLPAR